MKISKEQINALVELVVKEQSRKNEELITAKIGAKPTINDVKFTKQELKSLEAYFKAAKQYGLSGHSYTFEALKNVATNNKFHKLINVYLDQYDKTRTKLKIQPISRNDIQNSVVLASIDAEDVETLSRNLEKLSNIKITIK